MDELFTNILSGLIEAPVSYFLCKKWNWPCRGPLHLGIASIVATGVSHPQCWKAMSYLPPLWGLEPGWAYVATFFVVEILVVMFEGILMSWMANLRIDRALFASLLANSMSAFIGLIISTIFPQLF